MYCFPIIINHRNLNHPELIETKIFKAHDLIYQVAQWKYMGKKVAFTNGVFDIIHEGHIYSLSQAAKEADKLIVAVNSDASVKRLKGESRPVNNERSRLLVLASMIQTDAVVLFEEDTPLELIKSLLPDVLVKGGDYKPEQIAGAAEVIANGGSVVINPLIEGISTTRIIDLLKKT